MNIELSLFDVNFICTGGFLWVDDILHRNEYRSFTFDDIKHVVDTNDKKRFSLVKDESTGNYKIRANQGHSLEVTTYSLIKLLFILHLMMITWIG